jgi:hypothetical protein
MDAPVVSDGAIVIASTRKVKFLPFFAAAEPSARAKSIMPGQFKQMMVAIRLVAAAVDREV